MKRSLSASIVLIGIAVPGEGVRAGYGEETKVVDRANFLVASSSDVIVARVLGYRGVVSPGSEPAPEGMTRFEADLVVDRIESGGNLRRGDRIAVGFWSRFSKEQIETLPLLGSDCGDRHYPPQPGDMARIYLQRDEAGGFVSDHPVALFAIDPGPRRPYIGKRARLESAAFSRWGLVAFVCGSLALIPAIGLVRCRFSRPRMGEN